MESLGKVEIIEISFIEEICVEIIVDLMLDLINDMF